MAADGRTPGKAAFRQVGAAWLLAGNGRGLGEASRRTDGIAESIDLTGRRQRAAGKPCQNSMQNERVNRKKGGPGPDSLLRGRHTGSHILPLIDTTVEAMVEPATNAAFCQRNGQFEGASRRERAKTSIDPRAPTQARGAAARRRLKRKTDVTTAFARRGACPEPFAPMQTGDGLLARLPLGGRGFSLDAFSRLAAAANRFGNGLIEVTARGSLQIRGLSPGSALGFSGAITALGATGTVGPPIVGNPLAGLDPTELADASPLVALLRARCDEVAAALPLAAKISAVVDGGGVLHLDAFAADIRLRADTMGGRLLYHLAVGGDGTTATRLGAVSPDAAGEAVVSLLAVIGRHGGIRARDIVLSDGADAFSSAVANMLVDAEPPESRTKAEPIGRHSLRDGAVAVGVGLAFGQAAAGQVIALVEAARVAGASAIVPAEGRALLALGVRRDLAAGLATAADRLGFITRADDSRRGVIACAGAPACAAGKMPARDIAAAFVSAASGILDGSARIHLSGCAKGCAYAGSADLTLVGSDGGYGLVIGGDARAAPSAFLTAKSLAEDIAALGDRVRRAKRPEDSSAEVLARFGPGLLAAELAEASAR